MFKTYCRALIESFYNPRVYREAMTAWQGFSGLYLVLLSAITSLLLFLYFMNAINQFDTRHLDNLLAQIPEISIEEGLISVEAPQPVILKTAEQGLVIHIDTSASKDEIRQTGANIGVGRNFIFFDYQGNYEEIPLKQLRQTNFTINKNTLREKWDTNIPTIKTIAYPLIWAGQFVNLIIASVLVALLSYFITTFMQEEYDFLTRMRFAALALTPASLISMILKLTIAHNTAPWFSLLLALLYMYVMIILMRKLPPDDQISISI